MMTRKADYSADERSEKKEGFGMRSASSRALDQSARGRPGARTPRKDVTLRMNTFESRLQNQPPVPTAAGAPSPARVAFPVIEDIRLAGVCPCEAAAAHLERSAEGITMKLSFVLLIATAAGIASAEDALSFHSEPIEIPPLSALGAARAAQEEWLREMLSDESPRPIAQRRVKLYSRMPVKAPDPTPDAKMTIKEPDASTDHKMRVVIPELESKE